MEKIWETPLGVKNDRPFCLDSFIHYIAIPGEQSLRILNTKNMAILRYDISVTRPIVALAWHPNGRYIAASSLDKHVSIFDFKSEIAFRCEKLKH